METTPSLSCFNKCAFCWRYGTNPVGTTWRWIVDPPDVIFNGVASTIHRGILSNGLQADGSYKLNDDHTIRYGFTFTEEHLTVNTSNLVFPMDDLGNQSSATPFDIEDDSSKQA